MTNRYVGTSRLIYQDYIDNAALFTDNENKWPSILAKFNDLRLSICSVNVVFLGYVGMISSLMPKWLAEHIKRTGPN